MAGAKTSWNVWKDPEVAARFTDKRRAGVVGAATQFEVVADLVRQIPSRPLTVLDVGCGDGIMGLAVTASAPVSRLTLLDGSAAMLERAKGHASEAHGAQVDLVEADISSSEWTKRLPTDRYDVVVSAFAIHHIDNKQKREVYAKIHDILTEGGLFANVEHVASATPLGQELFEYAYARNLAAIRSAAGEPTTIDAIRDELRGRADNAANLLVPVETQLAWLREIGYRHVDCYCKHYELAVMAGYHA